MYQIPEPLLFNPLKHHLGFIRQFIKYYSRDASDIKYALNSIAGSPVDLYCGSLSTLEIVTQLLDYLKVSLLDNKISFIEYLNEIKSDLIVSLSDHSNWVLLTGNRPRRFVHIHPARNSPHTIRISSNTLKTLIASCITAQGSIGLSEINHARELIGLPSLQKFTWKSGIGRYIDLFTA